MNKLILAASAAALLGITPVAAQSTNMSAGSGASVRCSDVTAMDSASQSAFLQGYWAGRQDSMMGSDNNMASTNAMGTGAMDTDADNNAMSSSTDTAAADANAMKPATDATASTDATATGSTTTSDSSMKAGTSSSMNADGSFDANKILTACAGAPESSISDVMSMH